MLIYLINRILRAIPMVFLISFVAFWLSFQGENSPIHQLIEKHQVALNPDLVATNRNRAAQQQQLDAEIIENHYHLPLFYFRIGALAESKEIYSIYHPLQREVAKRLLWQNGNWELVETYLQSLHHLKHELSSASFEKKEDPSFYQGYKGQLLRENYFLLHDHRLNPSQRLKAIIDTIDKEPGLYLDVIFSSVKKSAQQALENYKQLEQNPQNWKCYIPKVFWHGTHNQYHKWITGIVTKGDFGISSRTKEPVGKRITKVLPWSMVLGISSMLIAFLLSIPLAIFMAYYKDRWHDQLGRIYLLGLDAIPNFWLATLLIYLFANPEILNWFPSSFNISDINGLSFWEVAQQRLWAFILPLIAYSYGALAFYTRQLRASLLNVLGQNYILTAKVKGLTDYQIWKGHVLKNAIVPMTTLFASIFPAMIGGSVILENIFSIPGMGKETWEAILAGDAHMIAAIFTITGALTIIGFLVTDLLYHWIDPRVRISSN